MSEINKNVKALDDDELDSVAGGVVSISRDKGNVAFTALLEKYSLKCSYYEARDLADELWENNQSLGDYDFDVLVKNELMARGWI